MGSVDPHLASRFSANRESGNAIITLDVVVSDKSGTPMANLGANDFNVFDNKQQQPLLSVVAAHETKTDLPVEAILLLDGINTSLPVLAEERQGLARFFAQNGGQMALPTSLLFLTDQGAKLQNVPTRDGAALLKMLNANPMGMRTLKRSAAFYGDVERRNLSLRMLNRIVEAEAKRPGRKLLLWIGPGWASFARADFTKSEKEDQELFAEIVGTSNALRAARMTLYSIDPRGVGIQESNFAYKDFLKGVASAQETMYGNLDLQVLAAQSGGQVLFGTNDLGQMLDQGLADARTSYALTYAAPMAAQNPYHAIEVQVDRPGLKARTRTGYYQPEELRMANAIPEGKTAK